MAALQQLKADDPAVHEHVHSVIKTLGAKRPGRAQTLEAHGVFELCTNIIRARALYRVDLRKKLSSMALKLAIRAEVRCFLLVPHGLQETKRFPIFGAV